MYHWSIFCCNFNILELYLYMLCNSTIRKIYLMLYLIFLMLVNFVIEIHFFKLFLNIYTTYIICILLCLYNEFRGNVFACSGMAPMFFVMLFFFPLYADTCISLIFFHERPPKPLCFSIKLFFSHLYIKKGATFYVDLSFYFFIPANLEIRVVMSANFAWCVPQIFFTVWTE